MTEKFSYFSSRRLANIFYKFLLFVEFHEQGEDDTCIDDWWFNEWENIRLGAKFSAITTLHPIQIALIILHCHKQNTRTNARNKAITKSPLIVAVFRSLIVLLCNEIVRKIRLNVCANDHKFNYLFIILTLIVTSKGPLESRFLYSLLFFTFDDAKWPTQRQAFNKNTFNRIKRIIRWIRTQIHTYTQR